MTEIKSLTLEELTSETEKLNLPKFRAKQIYQWLHQKGVMSFDEMLNLSKELRNTLKQNYYIAGCETEHK